MEVTEFNRVLEKVVKDSLDYLASLDLKKVQAEPFTPNQDIPEEGSSLEEVYRFFIEHRAKVMIPSSGPRYWGFVTGGTSPAALVGDWLTTLYDQNPQATNGHGDISALIEQETLAMLRQLLGLPDDFLGGFVSGATMSNFTCLAVARQWAGQKSGINIAAKGMSSSSFRVVSAVPHSSALKSLSMLGIGRESLSILPVVAPDREALDIGEFEKMLAEASQPVILISSGGTVNTVDFDDLASIAWLKKKYGFWWHIDAAFGGFSAVSDKYSYLVDGWHDADSITVDCHKWLNVPYESAIFLIKDVHRMHQVETFQNSNAPYLGDPLENFSFLNFLPENSRRLIALPAWFALRTYGKSGYRQLIEASVENARHLGEMIQQTGYFELLAPVRLNTVCFSLKDGNDVDNREFLNRLNSSGEVFMTPTVYKGRTGIRAALVNWRTTYSDVAEVVKVMTNIAKIIKK